MVEEFNLDFKELRVRDKAGYAFQALVAEIGRGLGYSVEEGGVGADGGRDLFFDIVYDGLKLKRETRRWLVSCKDFSESESSVGRAALSTVYQDAIGKKCHGILLACSTNPSNSLVEQLVSFETAATPVMTHVWNKHNIQQILHENEERFRLTLARFFPQSYGYRQKTSANVEQVLFSILEELPVEEAIAHAESLTNLKADPLVLWRTAETILGKKPPLEALFALLKVWALCEQSGFQSAITAALIEYFYEMDSYISDIGDELANEAPWFCGASPGWTEFELITIALKLEGDVVRLECGGLVEIEYTDSVDKDTGTSSFKASVTVEVGEYGFEITEPWVENPSEEDYLAEMSSDEDEDL